MTLRRSRFKRVDYTIFTAVAEMIGEEDIKISEYLFAVLPRSVATNFTDIMFHAGVGSTGLRLR